MPGLWYPSLVVNFLIRFDETFQIAEIPEPLPQGGLVDAISGASQQAKLRPLILDRGNSNLTQVANRVPRSAKVETHGYRQAGTFEIEIDWQELPIDPRLIRACGVEIYMGAVRDGDFGTGMTRVDADGSRRSIIRTTDENGFPTDSMILAGSVDNWAAVHNDRGSRIRMRGRDLRGVFLDSPVDPAFLAKLDLRRPIDEVVTEILDSHPAGGNIVTLINELDWPNGVIPSPADRDGLTRVRRKASGEGGQSTPQGGSKLNYWDIITQYCTLVGAVPFFIGRDLQIRPARSLFDQSKTFFDPNFSSPFRSPTGASVPRELGGQRFSVRKMIYGQNVKSLSFERKFTGTKAPVVKVVSIDTSSKERGAAKLIEAEWPPADKELARVSGVAPSGEFSQSDRILISKPGIRDPEVLQEIAKNLYEEIGRGELGGACETMDLASIGGTNNDPDLLRLRVGDATEFLVDTRNLASKAPLVAELVDSERRSFEEQAASVRRALAGKSGAVDENLVRVLVASSRSNIVDLLRTFRVTNIKYSWSLERLGIAFDFQNYFIVRHGVTEKLGANAAPVKRKTSTPQKKPKRRIPPQPEVSVETRTPTAVRQRRRPTGSGGGSFNL